MKREVRSKRFFVWAFFVRWRPRWDVLDPFSWMRHLLKWQQTFFNALNRTKLQRWKRGDPPNCHPSKHRATLVSRKIQLGKRDAEAVGKQKNFCILIKREPQLSPKCINCHWTSSDLCSPRQDSKVSTKGLSHRGTWPPGLIFCLRHHQELGGGWDQIQIGVPLLHELRTWEPGTRLGSKPLALSPKGPKSGFKTGASFIFVRITNWGAKFSRVMLVNLLNFFVELRRWSINRNDSATLASASDTYPGK